MKPSDTADTRVTPHQREAAAVGASLPEHSYNDIVQLASFICETPIALISFIDEKRQWFKAATGLEAVQFPTACSVCAMAAGKSDGITVFSGECSDRAACDNPLVAADPSLKFYAGAPLLTPEGEPFGTLCVIDRRPRQLTADQTSALRTLARQVTSLIELARQRHHLEQVLEENRRIHTELLGQNTILQNSHEGISHIGTDGKYVMANLRYAATCGYTPEEMVGMPWQATVHPNEMDRLNELCEQMVETGHAETETIGVRKDGSIFYKHVTMVPFFDRDGHAAGHYCFMRDITSQKIAERRLKRRAFHDELTGLPNRASLLETLGDLVARARRRPDYSFAILFMDLDLFKPINDKYGHAAGDAVLKEVARRLQSCIRPGDLAARIGGDEFVVLLDDIDAMDDAREVSDRIDQAMEAPFFWQQASFPVSHSIGIAMSAPATETAEGILDRADKAMYKVKESHRARPPRHATPAYNRIPIIPFQEYDL